MPKKIAVTIVEEINYSALYSHCKRNLKSKLKVARKSHYKKDENAQAFFKKPRM